MAGDESGTRRRRDVLRFGVWMPQMTPWTTTRERWQQVEALGFDSAWVVDHFVNPYAVTGPWLDGWSYLAAVASHTRTIRVGTLVTNIIYRTPTVVARQALTVDHISNGRLELGIGAGSAADPSHPMTGTPAWPGAERVGRCREFVEIVDHMLRQPVTTYRGAYYQVSGAAMRPAPVQQPRPPLTIAAHGPRMLRIAAQYADAWSSLRGAPGAADAVAVTRERNALLDELAAARGRDPATIVRSFCVGWTKEDPFVSIGAFHDFVGRYRDAGINEFIFGYWTDAEAPGVTAISHVRSADALERIAREAIPVLRRQSRSTAGGCGSGGRI